MKGHGFLVDVARWSLLVMMFAGAGAGCSNDEADPFKMGGGAGGSGGAGGDKQTGTDAGNVGSMVGGAGGTSAPGTPDAAAGVDAKTPPTPVGSEPKPARLIVLGDSIVACSNVGERMGADCSVKKLYDYLKATYAPNLLYENLSVGGAVTVDVTMKQLATVKTGAGHALVLIYIGGNDLAKYMFSTDAQAIAGMEKDMPVITDSWMKVFAFFADASKFPDGARLMMNSQYDPFDDCTAAPYNLTAKKIELLHTFNGELEKLAASDKAVFVDQFTPFLGHGHHVDVMKCPYYKPGLTAWMGDLIHPNAAGHENLFQQWKAAVDRLYGRP